MSLAACGSGGGGGGDEATIDPDAGAINFSTSQAFGPYTLRCDSTNGGAVCQNPTVYNGSALIGPLSGFGTIGSDGTQNTLEFAGTRLCQAGFGSGYYIHAARSAMNTVTPQTYGGTTVTVAYLANDNTWSTLTTAGSVNVFTALACTTVPPSTS